MFIKEIKVNNFRLFGDQEDFCIGDLNIPDGENEGSGLNLFVGENGCGKSSLLDAFILPLLSYKSDNFSIDDIFNPNQKTKIEIFTNDNFDYAGTMPKTKYKGKGFSFEGGIRTRSNNSYLSTVIVTDQKYIKADGETKPNDGTPDLRLSVNNPWSGPRFNENDIIFLDKNRTYQTRSGTNNLTRFDRLMEDLNLQYIKKEGNPIDCNIKLIDVKNGIENTFLSSAISEFETISGYKLDLSIIENWKPFSKGIFGVVKDNKQIISLSNLGSGYEMIFSLLYSFNLSKQSGKQLIVLIDEPELHLHPKLQEEFINVLLTISKSAQIIITTHSPLFVKQVLYNDNVNLLSLKRNGDNILISGIDDISLPYISANEINFIAFDLPTEEYHNELFEELKEKYGQTLNIKDFDLHYFQGEKGEEASYENNSIANQVSIHTYLRNQIHHRGNNGRPDILLIKDSIIRMRNFLLEI